MSDAESGELKVKLRVEELERDKERLRKEEIKWRAELKMKNIVEKEIGEKQQLRFSEVK